MPIHTMEYLIQDEKPDDLSKKLKWIGIAFLGTGILAVFLPVVFGMAIWAILGVLLVIGGIAQIMYAVQSKMHKGIKLLAGLLYLITGILFLLFPAAGIVSLALFIGVLFFLEGVFKIFYGFSLRSFKGSGWAIFSGFLSVLLAILIWTGIPEGAAWIVGIIIGIGLIVNGISVMALAASIKHV